MKMRSPLTALLLVAPVGALVVAIKTQPAVAGCNPFGCSPSSVAECNPFGCPNPPLGQQCTPFGCPPSPQATQQQQQPTQNSEQGRRRRRQRESSQPNVGGNPQAIQQCMTNLLYRTEEQKPFPAWVCVPNDVNCRTVRVRTEISESAAAQACQNAR